MGPKSSSARRRALLLTVGFSGLFGLLGGMGAYAYRHHLNHFEHRTRDLLVSVLPREEALFASWLDERAADAAHYANSPAAHNLLNGLLRAPTDPQARRRVAAWFAAAQAAHPEYRAVSVLHLDGRTLWASAGAESFGSAKAALAGKPDKDGFSCSPLQLINARTLTLCAQSSGKALVVFHVEMTDRILPSLGERTSPAPGAFDFYLARSGPEGVEVLDHDLARPGKTRLYRLAPGAAVAEAFKTGALASGPDHFGAPVFALPASTDILGWRMIGVRDLDWALHDSRTFALAFGLLGAAGVGGVLLLAALLLRSAEAEGAHAILLRDSLMEHAPDPILIISADARILQVNPAACRLYGYSEKELLGRPLSLLRLAEDAPQAAERVRQALASGSIRFETVHRTKDGSPLEVEINASTVELDGERVVQGIVRDITQQRKDVRQLSLNRRMLDKITQTLPTGIYAFDLERRMASFLSPAMEKVLGYSSEEVLGGGPAFLAEHFHPEDLRSFSADLERFRTMKDGETWHSQYRFRVKSGDYRWFRSQQTVFERDERGNPRSILGSLEDCTEEVVGRETLTAALARARLLAQAVSNAAESIVITDPGGTIQFLNPAAERASGFTSAEAVGKHARIFKSGRQDKAFYRTLWDTILRGEVWHGTFVNKRKGGALYEEEASIAPVRNDAGDITNFVAVKRDVSRERSLEAQLTQAQKLEAVGRLAGGVAHDFNNILTSILGYAQLAKDELPKDDPLREDIDEIEKGAKRASDLTRQLLIFSRKQVIQPRLVDPGAVVGALQKMLHRIIGENYRLVFTSETSTRLIKADPSQLEQVVMNFVVNSRDALPGGGDIHVSVKDVRLAESLRGLDGPIPAGSYAALSVKDSGTGISQEDMEHIFEPFFTTKPPGHGTGLGLATVYGIVKQGGAYLTVDSAPGEGTRMTVYWPHCDDSLLPEEDESARSRGGSESILLVEDEGAVRRLSERLLTWAGYSVTSCANPQEALAKADKGHTLLFTDVVMPGMSGKELAERLRRDHPSLKVLYTSGYSDEIISKQGMLEPGARLLQKPFSQEELFKAVRDALDS